MSISESPFGCCFLGPLFSLSSFLLFPSYWFVDRLLSSVVLISVEQSQGPVPRIVCLLLGVPVFLLLFLISLPLALVGLILWTPLNQVRRPFCYQRDPNSLISTEAHLENGGSFTFISANLCLLPDGLARFSNLRHTQQRTALISNVLKVSQKRSSTQHKADNGDATSICSTEDVMAMVEMEGKEDTVPCEDVQFPGQVSVMFPHDADFLCLQEVFDRRASRTLRRVLANSFPHILYDIGPSGPYDCGFKFFSSGLFLASRYPPTAAKYHYYPNSRGEDSLAAKGLLCVQVKVGITEEKQRIVGYFNCTHLHAPEQDASIRCEQMSLVLRWVSEFQAENRETGDIICFDILCGDLNFDNCSLDDSLEQNHEIFSVYKDPCRDCAGRDRPGTVGTLLRQEFIYHEALRTPEKLKRTLLSDCERRLYIAPPLPPGTGHDEQQWTGRRIDYILYRDSPLILPTVMDKYQFITSLAGLSDHIPVSLTLSISLPEITSL
ncbi:sphingomyelin phosphodiesterase 5-like [Pelobates fuscus]|uniref:sphingomyelin phosphodiesterase 5-like n=1 Tax=Pelobates fuscus TaxID=191477 RepID=UPI002FE48D4E